MVEVTAREIGKAFVAAERISSDWQAKAIEILRINKIADFWRRANPRFPGLDIYVHEGISHAGYTRRQPGREGLVDHSRLRVHDGTIYDLEPGRGG